MGPPVLHLKREGDMKDSLWSEVVILIALFVAIFLFPRTLFADWYGTTQHGSVFQNVQSFGAVGDGVTDNTAAFQAAINQNRGTTGNKAPAVIYVPPGRYVISNTLVLWEATQLIGDEDSPPTLVLAANSPGFSNPSQKKPFLVTTNGYNVNPASLDWEDNNNTIGGSANNTFYTEIQNISLVLAQGNSGAVGILWKVAQQTSLRNVSIAAVDAAIGIDAGGQADYVSTYVPQFTGGGTIEDVSITGGSIGLRATGSMWTIRSLHISSCTTTGVALSNSWTFTFVDLKVAGCPVAMSYANSMQVSILDSNLQAITGGQTFVADGSPYYVENTIGITSPGGAKFSGVGYVNGSTQVSGPIAMTRTQPMMLAPRPKLYPSNGSIVNVHNLRIRGDGVTDDTAALQQAINRYGTVFLPYGNYLVSNTLTLGPTSRIYGEATTQITLANNASGFSNPNSPKPVILVPSAATAQVNLANFYLSPGTGNPGAVLIRWGAGSNSGIWDVGTNSTNLSAAIQFQLFGYGGGVFSNMWNPGNATVAGLLGNSSGPAWFYGIEFEHMPSVAMNVTGASNYYFVTPEMENTPNAFEVNQSNNIWVYGLVATDWSIPQELVNFAGSSKLYFQGMTMEDLQELCITMPISPRGSCQLIPPQNPGGWSTFALMQFSTPPVAPRP
jgi:Pectate lyase superfamily protein